jgi:hypothetical protein
MTRGSGFRVLGFGVQGPDSWQGIEGFEIGKKVNQV